MCGTKQGAGIPLPPAPLLQPTGPAHVTPDWQPAPVVAYAGFWLRLVARVLDFFIIVMPLGIVGSILALSTGIGTFLKNLSGQTPDEAVGQAVGVAVAIAMGIGVVLYWLVEWLYFAGFESSSWQATPGKRVLNLVVTDLSGTRISFARATGRYFGKWVTGLIPVFIGYILAGITERKQALHDMIASTLVLRR